MGIEKAVGEAMLDLTKNETAVNTATKVMGMLFPYAGLEKKAVDMYISEIEKSDLSIEAKVFAVMNARKTLKKLKNQKEIADIAMENAKEGTDFTESSGVNEEWLERFMESASFVSAEDVQLIWGKILAKEFEKPGTTPPSMIRILSEITPELAIVFRKLCSMRVWMCTVVDGKISKKYKEVYVPFSRNVNEMGENGINFNLLNELETLGLIRLNTLSGYITTEFKEEKILLYVDGKLKLVEHYSSGEFPIGNVLLTSVGDALSDIIMTEEIPAYFGMLEKYMKENNVSFAEKHDFQAAMDGDLLMIKKIEENIEKT